MIFRQNVVATALLAAAFAAASVGAFVPSVSPRRLSSWMSLEMSSASSSPSGNVMKQAMLRNPSQSKDIMLHQLYEDWRKEHNKGDFDANRFLEFQSNYLLLQRIHERQVAIAKMERRMPPPFPKLNAYADMTEAEYNRMQQQKEPPSPSRDKPEESTSELSQTEEPDLEEEESEEEENDSGKVIFWGPDEEANRSDSMHGSFIGQASKPQASKSNIPTRADPKDAPKRMGYDAGFVQGGSPTSSRSGFSRGSSTLSANVQGKDSDMMSIDFPDRSAPRRAGPRPLGIADQDLRAPVNNIDPSASYSRLYQRERRSVETEVREPAGVTSSRSMSPTMSYLSSTSKAPPKAMPRPDQETTMPSYRVDPSASYPRQRPPPDTPRSVGISDQEIRAPASRVTTESYSKAQGMPSAFAGYESNPEKPAYMRPPKVSADGAGMASFSPDQETRAPSDRINPDSIHAAHWPRF